MEYSTCWRMPWATKFNVWGSPARPVSLLYVCSKATDLCFSGGVEFFIRKEVVTWEMLVYHCRPKPLYSRSAKSDPTPSSMSTGTEPPSPAPISRSHNATRAKNWGSRGLRDGHLRPYPLLVRSRDVRPGPIHRIPFRKIEIAWPHLYRIHKCHPFYRLHLQRGHTNRTKNVVCFG